MGYGLSDKGERLLEREEAFTSVAREDITPFTTQYSDLRFEDQRHFVTRVMNALYEGAKDFPIEPRDFGAPVNLLQCVLLYEFLEIRGRGTLYQGTDSGPKGFGISCYYVLEDYLLSNGLLDEDSWEEIIK